MSRLPPFRLAWIIFTCASPSAAPRSRHRRLHSKHLQRLNFLVPLIPQSFDLIRAGNKYTQRHCSRRPQKYFHFVVYTFWCGIKWRSLYLFASVSFLFHLRTSRSVSSWLISHLTVRTQRVFVSKVERWDVKKARGMCFETAIARLAPHEDRYQRKLDEFETVLK